jgi:hypothetical protein
MCEKQHFKWLVVCSYVEHGVESLNIGLKWMTIWHEVLGCVVCELEKIYPSIPIINDA